MEFQTNQGEVILVAEETVLWNHTLSCNVPSNCHPDLTLAPLSSSRLCVAGGRGHLCSRMQLWKSVAKPLMGFPTFSKYLEQCCLVSHKHPRVYHSVTLTIYPFDLHKFLVLNKVGSLTRQGSSPVMLLWSLKEVIITYKYQAGDCWPGSYRSVDSEPGKQLKILHFFPERTDF